NTKPAGRKPRATVVVAPKRGAGTKPTASRSRKVAAEPADLQIVADGDDLESSGDLDGQSEKDPSEVLSEDELDSPKTVETLTRKADQSKTRAGRKKEIVRKVAVDGEFEYTPTGTRQTRVREQSQGTTREIATRREETGRHAMPPNN